MRTDWLAHPELLEELAEGRRRGEKLRDLSAWARARGVDVSPTAIRVLLKRKAAVVRETAAAEEEVPAEMPAQFHRAPERRTDADRIIEITGRMAAALGKDPPTHAIEADQIIAASYLPTDFNAETLLASNDWQGVYMGPRAMRTRANIVSLIKPTTRAHVGDIFENMALSSWETDPELDAIATLKDETALINGILDEDERRNPGAKVLFAEGNHEHWFLKFIRKNAKPLMSAFKTELSIQYLVKAEERRMQWRAYKGIGAGSFDWHGLHLRHSMSSTVTPGANVQREWRRRPARSMVIGHNHRAETLYVADNERGLVHTLFSNGCLCYVKGAFEYLDGESDWVQSVLVAFWINGRLHVQLCPFVDHCTIVAGYYVTPDGAWKL